MLDRGYLRRLLAAPIDNDLRRWVLGLLVSSMTPRERRDERDRWFRAAAALVPGEVWTRVRRLQAIALEIRDELPAAPDSSTVRGCVANALLVCATVPSLKTLGRIVDKTA